MTNTLTMTTKLTVNQTKAANRDKVTGGKRSSDWPKVEHAHLKSFPKCAACGSDKHVQVHHKKPFHLHPDLELDTNNLISLCMDNDCHLYVGHGDDFKAYNPNVQEDAAKVFANKNNLKSVLTEVTANAKKSRLFE